MGEHSISNMWGGGRKKCKEKTGHTVGHIGELTKGEKGTEGETGKSHFGQVKKLSKAERIKEVTPLHP